MPRRYTVSAAVLEQRRAAGLALKSKVEPSLYYERIGRMGGRRFTRNYFGWMSKVYDCRHEESMGDTLAEWRRLHPADIFERMCEGWNEMRRADFAELADRYHDELGTRMMLELYEPGAARGRFTKMKTRKKNKKKRRKAECTK